MGKHDFIIISLDGGAGTGKSTTAHSLSSALNLLHVDTGSHYRTITRAFLNLGLKSDQVNQYLNKKPLTVVRPGNQTRRFTHIDDTIGVCLKAWKNNKCRFYSISNKKSYSILEVAKMFKSKIKFLKPRVGERYASALTKISSNNKIIQKYGKLQLKDYISSFIKTH